MAEPSEITRARRMAFIAVSLGASLFVSLVLFEFGARITRGPAGNKEVGCGTLSFSKANEATDPNGGNGWTFLSGELPDGEEVIDFYHAAGHLDTALAVAYGDTHPKRSAQFKKLRHVSLVLFEFGARIIESQQGLPIGSGVTEATDPNGGNGWIY